MPTLKLYQDGTEIVRNRGRFDDWCIFIDGNAPFDRDYFHEFVELCGTYGKNNLYRDFITLYNNTTDELNNDIFEVLIPEIANAYGPDSLTVEKLFGVLYAVMLAEENKIVYGRRSYLGKRVKGLALYQILFENFTIEAACSFSINKPWREIAQLCDERQLQR